MSSIIDLVVATGLFFVFVAFIVSQVLVDYTNFVSVLHDSELRTSAANVQNVLFGGKGFPEDWETRTTTPVRIGLINDMYRMPVVVGVKNGTDFNNATINFTVDFDPSCLNRTREQTIRIFNETNVEHQFTVFNRTLCPGNLFLRRAEIAVNVTVPANRAKIFYMYFSPETGINGTSYGTHAFPKYPNASTNVTNYTATMYPAETMKIVSPSKVRALRNLTYSQVAQTLGPDTRFELEVDAP